MRRRYKFIVIDSPPIMAATDAVIISALTDGVLLVVRSGETPKEAFTRARDLLAAVKCRLLGVVLNAVDSNAPDYYYSYRYYPYAYGYGYGEEVGKNRAVGFGTRRNEGLNHLGGYLAVPDHRRSWFYRIAPRGSASGARRRGVCAGRSFDRQRGKHPPPEGAAQASTTSSIRSPTNICWRSWWTNRTSCFTWLRRWACA